MSPRPAWSCAHHRAALLDFVDRREQGPATDAALAHLDRCRACESELTEIALAIAALRRLHAEVRTAEPPRDAWARLRAHVGRRPVAPWRWRLGIGGLMTSALLVGVLVGPLAIDPSRNATAISDAPYQRISPMPEAVSPAELRTEQEFLLTRRENAAKSIIRPISLFTSRVLGVDEIALRIFPDGVRPEQKEVESAEASARPSGAS